MDKMDEGETKEGGKELKEVKKEEEEGEEFVKDQQAEAGGGAKAAPEMGRLVMTIDGEQKQLPFGRRDLLTTATMLDGDKVRPQQRLVGAS